MAEIMKDRQHAEGVKRLRYLGIIDQTVTEFEKYNIVNLSEGEGYLYWLDENERKMVKRFEDENEAVVYHVIKTLTLYGVIYELLYVSKWTGEWKEDMADLKDGQALAYGVNVDMPDCSEFGTIGIQPINGGVKRVW